jgi:hypothetical protein
MPIGLRRGIAIRSESASLDSKAASILKAASSRSATISPAELLYYLFQKLEET